MTERKAEPAETVENPTEETPEGMPKEMPAENPPPRPPASPFAALPGLAALDTAAESGQVEALGRLQFSEAQVARILDRPTADIAGGDPELSAAFARGRLMAQAMLRHSLLKMALHGSSPAQRDMLAIIQRTAETFQPGHAEACRILAELAGEGYVCDFAGTKTARPPGWKPDTCPCPHCSAQRWLARHGRREDRP